MAEDQGEQREVVFAGERPSATLSDAVRRGELRRLGRGVYTSNLVDDPAEIAMRNWLPITAHRFPGAVVTDRSARRALPERDGHLFVAWERPGTLELPGLVIVARRGAGHQADDLALPGGLWLASRPRALLENLRPSRRSGTRPPRTLGADAVAEWIDHLCHTDGEEALAGYRRAAEHLAVALDATPAAVATLAELIGAALGSRSVASGSPALDARQRGLPYDQVVVTRFELLAQALLDRPLAEIPDLPEDAGRRLVLPFFEAYFSNFIEGTEFTPDEAERIVSSGAVPPNRPADGHDILGTYRQLADVAELRREPPSARAFTERLQRWHRSIMEGRPDARPGEWKRVANRAGSTTFVAPDLAVGTLVQAWHLMQRLNTPAQRATFVLFAVAEVHPFVDGNGRLARVAMTAELVAGDQVRVIVPTVCRNDYLAALRRLARQDRPDLLIDVVDRLQRFTARIDFSSFDVARGQLAHANAFVAADDAERRGIHLLMPGS